MICINHHHVDRKTFFIVIIIIVEQYVFVCVYIVESIKSNRIIILP